jgi:uncharacterized protein with HEPN domain
MKNHQTLAKHILDAISQIEQYTLNVGKDEFLLNFMIQDAVVRKLEIIGEASRHINSDVKEKFPDIPWRDIIAMRNKLVHEYFSVDAETVWNVVQLDLLNLKDYAQRVLNWEEL